MAFQRHNKFTSKADAMSRAKRYHACLDCRHSQHDLYKICPNCGSKNRQYFMSKTELHRGMLLLTLQAAGTLSKLRFQPQYDLKVNGILVCKYRADAEYYRDGKLIVEDSKAKNTDFIEPSSKIKMALFQAVYGFPVSIPQRAPV